MIDLKHMFMAVKTGLQTQDERYRVIDDQHIMDVDTGIKYHLYHPNHKKPYEVSVDGDVIITGSHMTQDEATILDTVRQILPKIHADSQRKMLLEMWSESDGTMEDSGYMNGGLR